MAAESSLHQFLDRFWLRLWWWSEGRALKRMARRWPSEFRDFENEDTDRADFLTTAYQALVVDRV